MGKGGGAAEDPWVGLDGLALAALVRRGAATPGALLEAAIARAERLNPLLNAINLPMYDEARRLAAAGPADGPYRGVPFLIKDIGLKYAGFPTAGGCRLLKDAIATYDSELVRRLKRAGLVIFGKTNTPEFGTLGTTEPLLFGPTRNPWDPAYSPGGSSGGSAAAVAARIVPAAQGGDGAGSVRIPASCCGVVGLKPTRGRITLAPDLGESQGGITTPGILSLTVRDCAALLDAVQGPSPGDPYYAPPPPMAYQAAIAEPPGALKVAYTRRSPIATTLEADCVAAVEDAAGLLAGLGHRVVEDAPPLDAEAYQRRYRRFWPLTAAKAVHRIGQTEGRGDAAATVEPFNRWLYEQGMGIRAVDYLLDLEWFHAMGRDFARWMLEGDYDAWLTPTLGTAPPRLGHFDAGVHGGPAVMDRFMEFLPFTPLSNLTGQPAISLPLAWNPAGLPIGSHFVGRYGDEALLLRLAAQLEAARPWAARKPPITA